MKTSTVGIVIIILSFCFGFGEFFSVMSASQAGLVDIAFLIAYYGMTVLWLLLGTALLISGTIVGTGNFLNQHHTANK
jgi:hypothetical protein